MSKILVVDDDPFIRSIYQVKLEREGYDVLTAKDGAEGVTAAIKEIPGLIILDLIMPQVDGLAALELLKHNEKTRAIPVLVLTNRSDVESRKRAEKLGADGVFLKAATSLKQMLAEVEKRLPPPHPDGHHTGDGIEVPSEDEALIKAELERLRKQKPGRRKKQEIILAIPPMPPPFKKRHRILLIEDDPILARLYQTKLELENQAVFYAANGEDGLHLLKTEHPDGVILDMRLPGVSGLEILGEMKNAHLGIPAVVLSNIEDPKEMKKALALGATAYIIKSQATPRQVMEKLAAVLENKNS